MKKLIIGCLITILSMANTFAGDDARQSSTSDPVLQSVEKSSNPVVADESTAVYSNKVAAIQPDQNVLDASASPTPTKSYYHYPQVRSSSRSTKGLFSNLMELERKKNAWLKRTFLGM